MVSAPRPVLQVEELKTYYYGPQGVVKILDGVTFHLKHGETLGLVGESGCGKTMTGLSIVRLLPLPGGRIVGGRIQLDGEDLLMKTRSEMRRIRGRRISMILQDPQSSLNPQMRVGAQVAEAISLHQKISGRLLRDRVIESLKLVRIPAPESRINDYPHQMSGGMKQRITGAIALSCRPQMIVADEPTTSLDVTVQAQYLQLIKELQNEIGTSVLFITHDFGIVAGICDRVAVMYAGRIVETGAVLDIFDRPRHPYTRALIGCLPDPNRPDQLAVIGGQPPDLLNPPPGCAFNPRCSDASDICNRRMPETVQIGEDHFVSCWRQS
jgi:oligopeptide/dipeptide ABC transporter ATP-binding protein